MSDSWFDSYTGQLRKLVGHQKLIVPSIRAIVTDPEGKILFIRRKGNGCWAMPAGAIELNESIFGCLQREVKEETGLDVHQATLISIYTDPRYTVTTSYGDEYQGFEFLFHVHDWSGSLELETDETIGAQFFSIDDLPVLEEGYFGKHHEEVLEDFMAFSGVPFVK